MREGQHSKVEAIKKFDSTTFELSLFSIIYSPLKISITDSRTNFLRFYSGFQQKNQGCWFSLTAPLILSLLQLVKLKYTRPFQTGFWPSSFALSTRHLSARLQTIKTLVKISCKGHNFPHPGCFLFILLIFDETRRDESVFKTGRDVQSIPEVRDIT